MRTGRVRVCLIRSGHDQQNDPHFCRGISDISLGANLPSPADGERHFGGFPIADGGRVTTASSAPVAPSAAGSGIHLLGGVGPGSPKQSHSHIPPAGRGTSESRAVACAPRPRLCSRRREDRASVEALPEGDSFGPCASQTVSLRRRVHRFHTHEPPDAAKRGGTMSRSRLPGRLPYRPRRRG